MKSKNQKGQTLIEIVLILGLIIIGLLGILAVVIANISGGDASKKMIVASNLAREGVEAARQIRDSNWLDCGVSGGVAYCSPWDDGLLDEAETPSTAAIAIFNAVAGDPAYNTWSLLFLPQGEGIEYSITRIYLNTETGLYLQAGSAPLGSPTIYSRLIRLNEICGNGESGDLYGDQVAGNDQTCDQFAIGPWVDYAEKVGFQVKSEVKWLERDRQRSIIAEDKIYNWR